MALASLTKKKFFLLLLLQFLYFNLLFTFSHTYILSY